MTATIFAKMQESSNLKLTCFYPQFKGAIGQQTTVASSES